MGIRVPWEHEIVGSIPTTLIDVMRWVLCWYGKATVNRRDAGSIPATAALSGNWLFEIHTCPWPSGKGASLPSWTGGFDSRRALFTMRGSFCW